MKLAAILLSLLLPVHASPLDQWATDWQNGTAFAEYSDYKQFYEETTDRKITFHKVFEEPGVILTEYEASLFDKVENKPVVQRGIAAFWLDEQGNIYTEEHVTTLEGMDMALAGQVADVASTAIGISQGFVEGNPFMSGSPGGLAAMLGIKVFAAKFADKMSLANCIEAKTSLAGIGWGAAAWNLGLVLANPAVGFAAGVLTTHFMWDRPAAFRACAVAKLKDVQ